jgi:hypothetical protein
MIGRDGTGLIAERSFGADGAAIGESWIDF